MKKDTTDVIYLSKEGMKELKTQINNLEHDIKRLTGELRALSKGQKKEDNLERSEKLFRLEAIKAEQREKKDSLSKAKLIPKKSKSKKYKVSIGSIVELIDWATGKILKFTVVESVEANPSEGKISVNSPLGKSLVGKQEKDTVTWEAGLSLNQMQLVRVM